MFKRRERGDKRAKLEELVLPTAKLKFSPEQLHNLNFIFQKKLQKKTPIEKNLVLAKSVTERLVQRLVCCAGILDPRFASKFLIASHCQLNSSENKLEYIVRIDSLSRPSLYESDPVSRYSVTETDPDYPAGYARLRLHTTSLKVWNDCANSAGYLRRDKVQARLVELLAQAAASDSPNSPLNVDESCHCGTPGKVVDPSTLQRILKIPSNEHVFYGPGGNVPRFPDPRDFRLAIVDEPKGARLKVEFLSPALSSISIDVRLLIAIGIDAWPSSTNFPSRVTLGHSDCLLYHQAAQTGMYLVGFGVQSSAWQIRLPAAQDLILNHYGANSTFRTILDVLFETLQEIGKNRSRRQTSYKILNKYILFTMLLKRLEDNSSNPSKDLIEWSPLYLSSHVLLILDRIIATLHVQNLPNYFFKKSNLLVNPGHLCEDDYGIEANNVKGYLLRLFDESLMSTRGDEDFKRWICSQESEMILLQKWRELIDNLMPPISTRGRRFCFARNRGDIPHSEYTQRQMEYIGILLENLLNVKQQVLTSDSFMPEEAICRNIEENRLEDVIYLLVAIMDQARDKYLNQRDPAIAKNRSKIKSQFNSYTSKLVEIIRKDKEMSHLSFNDDLSLVKIVLRWLYKAMDHNKRYLGPILRPYLNNLFASSHAISWHLDFIKQRLSDEETKSMGAFAKLVNEGRITPAEGLIDAVNKDWNWAKKMLRMVERNTLRVVFISERGKVYRHILSLPSYQRGEGGSRALNGPETKKQLTLPASRNYFNTLLTQRNEANLENIPHHEILKNSSPLTCLMDEKNRRGDHRGYGDILRSLQSMQKLSMFQQITLSLPQEDREEIQELIQAMQSMKTKKSSKKWSATLPQRKITPKSEKYTPTGEGAGVEAEKTGTLIGSCRAARIREDNSVFLFQDSFKIKSLLNKSESFKF